MENMKSFYYDVVKNLTDEEALYYNKLLMDIYKNHDDIIIFKEKVLELQNKLLAEYIIKQNIK